MSWESIKLQIGTPTEPGPGFLPLVATLTIGVLSFIGLISKIRNRGQEKSIRFHLGTNWLRALLLMALSFFYILFLWSYLGFILSSIVWLLLTFRLGGLQSWPKNVLLTLIIVLASDYIFGKFGGCLLPIGPLGF